MYRIAIFSAQAMVGLEVVATKIKVLFKDIQIRDLAEPAATNFSLKF
jgi:hypothetical protein